MAYKSIPPIILLNSMVRVSYMFLIIIIIYSALPSRSDDFFSTCVWSWVPIYIRVSSRMRSSSNPSRTRSRAYTLRAHGYETIPSLFKLYK